MIEHTLRPQPKLPSTPLRMTPHLSGYRICAALNAACNAADGLKKVRAMHHAMWSTDVVASVTISHVLGHNAQACQKHAGQIPITFLILYLLATFPLSLGVSASASNVANVGAAVIADTNTIIFQHHNLRISQAQVEVSCMHGLNHTQLLHSLKVVKADVSKCFAEPSLDMYNCSIGCIKAN